MRLLLSAYYNSLFEINELNPTLQEKRNFTDFYLDFALF